jgi:hypothetical protein
MHVTALYLLLGRVRVVASRCLVPDDGWTISRRLQKANFFIRSALEEKKLFNHCAGFDTDLVGQILDTYSSRPYVESQGYLNEDLWSLVSSLLT